MTQDNSHESQQTSLKGVHVNKDKQWTAREIILPLAGLPRTKTPLDVIV